MNGIRWSGTRSACILLALAISACGGDSSGPPKAGPPATLAVVSGTGQQGESGEALTTPLSVKVTDAQGLAVSKAVVTFVVATGGGTLSQPIDTTDTEGVASVRWTMGGALGDARVEARVTGVIAPVIFTAQVKAGPPSAAAHISAAVGNSASGFDLADSVAIRVVDRFQHPVVGAAVTFSVTAGGGTISHATRTTGDDGIARTAWKLGNAGAQTLRAASGSISVEVQGTAVACEEKSLAIGQVASVAPVSSNCIVTNGSGTQKYLIVVSNTSATPTSIAAFRLRGAGGSTATSTDIVSAPARVQATSIALAGSGTRIEHAHAHADVMRANTELLQRLAPARRAQIQAARRSDPVAQQQAVPNIGDILSVKIPNFNGLCNASIATNIRARVVYVGSRSVILEDSAAALAGEFDDRYDAVGSEFDNVMFPILNTNFGNPLAMDEQTDQNGRIFMVFSPVVNGLLNGTIAGFVSSGDFFDPNATDPNLRCGASNFGEYFYARVPTVAGTGTGAGSVADWAWSTRTVIMHEAKHIVSFAEKFASPEFLASGFFQRDAWLEESSAMLAEELWARSVFGYSRLGNVDYASSIHCELNSTTAACLGKPRSMLDHFYYLYYYATDAERRSTVGPVATDDFTYYGSGWMFLRWIVDNYGVSEAALLRALTTEMTNPGTDNIAEHTGKSFAELTSEFALALALDDYPGFTPSSPKLSIQSWNTRNIFAGLHGVRTRFSGNLFPVADPLVPRSAGLGRFVIDVSSVTGGGFSIFQVSGTSANKQLLEFRGMSGTGFPADMRVNIVRVQ